MSPEAVCRLGCDCGVVRVIEDDRGVALSVGRRTRTVPGAMKQALLRRDRTCRFPGCHNRVFLEGHHIEHWMNGGATELGNLLALCNHHHRFVHEYGYQITTCANGEIELHDHRGRAVRAVPDLPKPGDRGMPAIRGQNRDLAITAETPACGWDGHRVDYGLVIDCLVRAEPPPGETTN